MSQKEDSEYCKNFKINQNIFRIKQLYNKPLTRFSLISPYYNEVTGEPAKDAYGKPITKERLDMRRKAEILKYSSNRMSTQTNNMTKKEKWAQLVKSGGKSAGVLGIENEPCPNDALIPMPSSASGVPGSIYLYEDPSVPLYNYTNINRTYAFDVPNRNEYWDTTVNTNVVITGGGGSETVFAMSVHRNVNNNTATYAVTIPLGIHLEGKHTSGLNNVTCNISSATLYVYCNNQLRDTKNEEKVYKNMVIGFINNPSTNTQFSATQYVGNISFSDITLQLSDAYVFEFKIALTTSITPSYEEGAEEQVPPSFKSFVYANITDSIIPKEPTGCTILSNQYNVNTISTPSLFGRL
jgi:hypothetical protein